MKLHTYLLRCPRFINPTTAYSPLSQLNFPCAGSCYSYEQECETVTAVRWVIHPCVFDFVILWLSLTLIEKCFGYGRYKLPRNRVPYWLRRVKKSGRQSTYAHLLLFIVLDFRMLTGCPNKSQAHKPTNTMSERRLLDDWVVAGVFCWRLKPLVVPFALYALVSLFEQ